jgi:hypothetical protein
MRNLLTILCAAAVFLAPATSAIAQEHATQFTRVSKDSEGHSLALQTAIVTYVPRDNATEFSVDLVSAIHIADKAYYEELNERFQEYDALLYELVMPDNAVISQQPANGKGLLSGAQLMLGKLLDLTFQLDEIDYSAANFVHADLSPQQLEQSMIDRDESLYVYFWRLYFMAMQDFARDPYGVDDLATMVASGQGFDLKTVFAHELTNFSMAGDFLAGDSGSAVIGARNERALEVLQQQIESRKKRVGIFYGAAHLSDLEQRLLTEFGLIHHKTVWIDAWKLADQAGQSPVD